MARPLPPEEVARRLAVTKQGDAQGLTRAQIAAQLGIERAGTLNQWLSQHGYKPPQDPGIRRAMDAVQTNLVPSVAWLKTAPDDEGNSFSVMLRPEAPQEDFLERVAEAFASIPAAPSVTAPVAVLDDYCAVYPLFDAHFGMHAWGRETGRQDYDLRLAASDLLAALDDVMAVTPAAKQAIFLLGGDTLHADNDNAETKKSKHKLDVDGRHYKVIDTVIEVIAHGIERLLTKHEKVTVRVMRGNHDEDSHLVLPMALAQRYREEPRVEVVKDPRDLFMFQWGKCGIFAHHGDKQTFQRMFNLLAAVCPFWSDAPFRHYLSGHFHSEKSVEIGGMVMETLRPFCPPDAYGSMWPSVRALQSLTFHKRNGLVLRAYDPILRAA